MSIIEECIPKGVLPPRKNLPWLNKNLICAMKKRNQLYKKAKQTGDFSRYKLARNRAVSNLRREKKAYFGNLNPKNPKKFWKAVKYLNKMAIEQWVLDNHLTFNTSKCNYLYDAI